MTLSTIIADHHDHGMFGLPKVNWCQGCDEPWPCATVALLRECRDMVEQLVKRTTFQPVVGGIAAIIPFAQMDAQRDLLARLAEPEVTA